MALIERCRSVGNAHASQISGIKWQSAYYSAWGRSCNKLPLQIWKPNPFFSLTHAKDP